MDSERLSIGLFRRYETGHSVLYPSEDEDTLEFASVGLSESADRLYEDVNMAENRSLVNDAHTPYKETSCNLAPIS